MLLTNLVCRCLSVRITYICEFYLSISVFGVIPPHNLQMVAYFPLLTVYIGHAVLNICWHDATVGCCFLPACNRAVGLFDWLARLSAIYSDMVL